MATSTKSLRGMRKGVLIASIAAAAMLIAFGGYAYASYETKVIGIGDSTAEGAKLASASQKLQLSTDAITQDSVATLATPALQDSVPILAASASSTSEEEQATSEETEAATSAEATSQEQETTVYVEPPVSDETYSDSGTEAYADTETTTYDEVPASASESSYEESQDDSSSSSSSEWYSCKASWYDDRGGDDTASGKRYYYGIAHKTWAFGTAVEIEYNGNTIVAYVDDRGPYISGREIDLNQNCAAALGFDGVGTVHYRFV